MYEGHAPVGVMPPKTMVTSGLRLLCRTISGSVVLSQPRSVLMSMVRVANKDHIGAQGMDQTYGHESV